MNKQETINEILENFDFARVHKVMTFLNWEWFGLTVFGVPSEVQIRMNAKDLLGRVYSEAGITPHRIATGGLSATSEIHPATGKVYLELTFELVGWDNYD